MAALALDLLDETDAMAEELATRICAQIPIYGPGSVVSRDELKRSLTANVSNILGQLSGHGDADFEAPRRIGRDRATQDLPIAEVLRAYRFGFTYVWQRLLDAARSSGPDAVDGLLDTSTTIWELSDQFSNAMTDSYRRTMGERMISADRRRSGILAAILDGPGYGSHSAWEVAKLLNMPYEGTFLVLVTEANEPTVAQPHLEHRLRPLDVTSAWRARPDHEIGLLSLGRRDTAPVLDVVSAATTGRVGVSPLFDRLDGAARALRLAQVALDSLPPGTRGLRQLDDDPQVDLLVRDRETTRRFVNRVLGSVLALPGDDRTTLLATATAWVDAHGSAAEAGRVLYCHENTVRHRIHRLEEHLGTSLDDPRSLGDLITALQAIRTFPELGNPAAPDVPTR